MNDNIILIGFMAAGKDTVARVISDRTGRAWLSLDRLIELRAGQKIADIFQRNGESYFRKIEKAALASVTGLRNIVLATGGGTVLDPQNCRRLKRMGLVIHLRTGLPVLEKRLKNDRIRPLVRDRSRIRKIYGLRVGKYDFADRQIDTDRRSPAWIADGILENEKVTDPILLKTKKIVEVRVSGKIHPIVIAAGVFARPSILKPFCRSLRRGIIVTNPVVAALYLDQAIAAFRRLGVDLLPYILADGENRKNLNTVSQLYDRLLCSGFDRSDCLVSLGGGVITDLTAFAAATYKRGLKLIHVPTTLLAQVDAAIGGKCGVNHAAGKNLIGAFYQPDLVVCDPALLSTLPDSEFRNGLAEVVKYGFIGCAPLFTRLEADTKAVMERGLGALADLVGTCAQLKRRVVERDEREEKGLREVLNFGHTVGHALERHAGYARIAHGRAVAIGMIQETLRAVKTGALSRRDGERLGKLLERFGLPTARPVGISRLALRRHIRQDKKIRNGKLRVPVPVRVGKIIIKEVKWENFL